MSREVDITWRLPDHALENLWAQGKRLEEHGPTTCKKTTWIETQKNKKEKQKKKEEIKTCIR